MRFFVVEKYALPIAEQASRTFNYNCVGQGLAQSATKENLARLGQQDSIALALRLHPEVIFQNNQ